MRNAACRNFAGLMLLAGLLVLSGCTYHKARLPFHYNQAGIPEMVKRVERHPVRNWFHHWVREAYRRPSAEFLVKPGTDAARIKNQWGKPDWVRKPFRSLANERVHEWIYLEEMRLFQFIGDQLVFEGPLTDYEQVLLQRGYPDYVFQTRYETGTDEEVFIYHGVFIPKLEQFHFMNGELTQSQEGS